MIDLMDLRAFTRIADFSGISAAARSLGLPKSSVSRSLGRLEGAIGVALVERSTRHAKLTDAGLVLQRHARRILDGVTEAEDEIAGMTGEARGDLRITAPFTFVVGPIATMMSGFLRDHPHVRVAITTDNRVVDLVGEEYDVAIRVGVLPDSGLIARRLTNIAMWLCASPDYLRRSQPVSAPTDLQEHLLISYGRIAHSWKFGGVDGALADPTLQARVVVDEPDAMLKMLLGGAGIGLLPDFVASEHVGDDRLIRLLPDVDLGSVPVHALYPSHRSLSPKVRAFIDALAAHLR